MAAPCPHHRAQEILQGSLPHGRIRIYHDPHLSVRPDRVHGLLQGRRQGRQSPVEKLVAGRGGETVPVLQQGNPQGELCITDLCTARIEVIWWEAGGVG